MNQQKRTQLQPDTYYLRSDSLLDTVGKLEAQSWLNHPCTKAFLLTIEGDLRQIIEQWMAGVHTDSSAYGTAQKNAEALGKLQAMDQLRYRIEEIGESMLKGEDYDQAVGTQDPN